MKADPFAQRRLLDLQAIDTDLDRARYRAAHLPEAVAAAEAARLLAKVQDQQVAISTELSDVKRELTRAEHDVATVRARADRDRSRLASGEITSSKALTDLEHEVESLARRQRDLEDAELAVMEQVEELETALAAGEQEAAKAQQTLVEARQAQAAAAAELERDVADLQQRQAAVRPELPAELVALYDRLRADGMPVAAGLVRYGRCESCQMELSRADLSAVRSAPVDEVVRCPECRAIMVRTEESGL